VRQAVEAAFLSIIGYVNRAVFFASRGRVVPWHEVIRLGQMPVARLRLHHQPASGSVAISGIWTG
jgi:hypothetical protein